MDGSLQDCCLGTSNGITFDVGGEACRACSGKFLQLTYCSTRVIILIYRTHPYLKLKLLGLRVLTKTRNGTAEYGIRNTETDKETETENGDQVKRTAPRLLCDRVGVSFVNHSEPTRTPTLPSEASEQLACTRVGTYLPTPFLHV